MVECDGILDVFEEIGGVVLVNVCGFCIGQWVCYIDDLDCVNSIIISFNWNFVKCNDGNFVICVFVVFFELVIVMVIFGEMIFNLFIDIIINENGEEVKLDLLSGVEFLLKGFEVEDVGFIFLIEDGSGVNVVVVLEFNCLQLFILFELIINDQL